MATVREDLQQFMVEKLLELDPSLSTTAGSKMFTTVINPLLTRLGTDPLSVDIQTFIVSRVADEHPDLDVSSPGSFLRDVIASAMSVILEPLRREIQHLRTQKSLADSDALNDEEIDALLANVLVTRREGSFSYATVRVYFSTKRAVGVDQTARFSTTSGVDFMVVEPRVYLATDMTRAGNLWYLDVPVQSVTPSIAANVGKGEIKVVKNIDGVVRAHNPLPATLGVSRETNEEILDRASRSLTERSLTTARGIETAINENIVGVVSVEVIGFGEAGMQRDVLSAELAAPDKFLLGEVVYCTTQFKTLPLGHITGSANIVPFTNILTLVSVPQAVQQRVMSAKYLQVVDGSGQAYSDSLLSRVREIDAVSINVNDITVRLKDFSVYPAPASVGALSFPVAVYTDSATNSHAGFNEYGAQGSDYYLFRDDGTGTGTEYPVGAPLPFTDVAYLDTTNLPGGVELGRDFLYIVSRDTVKNPAYSNLTFNALGTDYIFDDVPVANRMFPVDGIFSGCVRVGRADSFLASRALLPGGVSGGYSPALSYSALNERIRIIAFGAPSSGVAAAVSYDGSTVDSWGVHAGASMHANPTDASTVVVPQFKVGLHPSQATWADMGVSAGDHISLAWCDSVTGGEVKQNNFASRLLWQGWGKIASIGTGIYAWEATVVGCDITPMMLASGGHNPVVEAGPPRVMFKVGIATAYPLYWTVYRGARDLVRTDGRVVVSNDETAYLSSYKVAAFSSYRVARKTISDYVTAANDGFFGNSTSALLDSMDAVSNQYDAFYIRLGRKFTEQDPGIGAVPAAVCESAQVVTLDVASDTAVTALDVAFSGAFVNSSPVPSAVHSLYPKERLSSIISAKVDDGGAATDVRLQPVSLPFTTGATATEELVDYTSGPAPSANVTPVTRNPTKQFGYLLPHPMGKANSSTTLDQQVVQVFAGEEVSDLTFDLTLSGLPGGVPFTDVYPGEITFANNEVHIGGMADVYIKTAAPSVSTADAIVLTPDDLTDSDVLLVAADLALDPAAPTIVSSVLLYNFLSNYYNVNFGVDQVGLADLVLELHELPSSDISPKSVRLSANSLIAPQIYVDGTFTNLGAAIGNVKFRLLRTVSTSVVAPVVVLQQGTDAITINNSVFVEIPSGITTSVDLTTNAVYLDILSGPDKGAFQVVAKSATKFTLDRALSTLDTGVAYRVYTKQASGLSLPFIKVNTVTLANDEAGVAIPYKHPVGVLTTSVAGLDDDPVDNSDVGLSLTIVNGGSVATITSGYNFETTGKILPYDVLVLDDADDPNKYFYVTAVNGVVLTLDRNHTLPYDLVTSSYKIGRPAVGSFTVLMKEPTYLRVDGNTVFTYTRPDGTTAKFRPSRTERGYKYAPRTFVTDADISAGTTELLSADDMFLLGYSVGDQVDLMTRVLQSDAFTATTREQLSVAGSVLIVSLDGTERSAVFSGSNPMSISEVADQINQQLGAYMYAEEYFDGAASYYLRISTYIELQLLTSSSSGLLDSLKFLTAPSRNNVSFVGALPVQVGITAVSGPTGGVYKLEITDNFPGETTPVFYRVYEEGAQIFYPADMVLREDGFYAVNVKVTSYDPFTSDIIPVNTVVDVTGYSSLGYELAVDNSNYSFSTLEDTNLVVSGFVLSSSATSLLESYATPRASVSISYDYAEEVSAAQQYLLQPSMRPVCANLLARHFLPAYPVVPVSYQGLATETDVQERLVELFTNLYPNRALRAYDVMVALSKLPISSIAGPLSVGYLTHDSTRKIRLLLSTDSVVLEKGYHVMGELDHTVVSRSA